MANRTAPNLKGFYEPWRVSGEPLFLNEENFHLLVDQPLLTQARVALARGAGAWWKDKCPLSFQIKESGPELSVQLTQGDYAGFTAAGLPVRARVDQDQSAKARIEQTEAPMGVAVALRAHLRPHDSATWVVAISSLPVDPTWLAMHLPVGIAVRSDTNWVTLEWRPRTVPASWPDHQVSSDSTVETTSPYESELRSLSRSLEQRVLRLLEAAERYSLAEFIPALHAILTAMLTVSGEASLTVRWNSILHAARLFLRIAHRYNPFETRWPDWIHMNFGAVPAHFDTPTVELVQKLDLYVNQLVSALQCLPFEYGPLRAEWWMMSPLGSIHILPGLISPKRKAPELRAARLVGIGQENVASHRWEIRPIPASEAKCDTVFLIMIPLKDLQKTIKVGLRLQMGSVAEDYKMRFDPDLAWGACRAPDQVVAAYRTPGSPPPLSIQYEVGLPPLAACLMFEIL